MTHFRSAREAKEFLASEIAEEAQRENVPLSELERKMLYFSESGWTLPDMSAVSDEFDRTCDQDEYETKIVGLIANAYQHAKKNGEYGEWHGAIGLLSKQDHYIIAMIKAADLRPRWDRLKLLGAGLVVTALIVGLIFLKEFASTKYGIDFEKYWLVLGRLYFLVWVAAICAGAGFLILRWTVGARRANEMLFKLFEKVFRVYKRVS
jgi:hypothetical protein